MAHKLVGIEDMVSIEKHEVGFRRAVFNSPFATVDVKLGLSSTVLPSLYDDEGFRRRPWMIWLDYDFGIRRVAQRRCPFCDRERSGEQFASTYL